MRVLQFAKGAWCTADSLSPGAARDLAYGPTHVWIRLEGIAQDKLEALGAVFNLHPLAIEDVRNHRQRPKVEDYDDLTFVVARAPRWDPAKDELSWLTVGLFLGPDFLITACTDPVVELDAVEKRLMATKASSKSASIDHVFYQVLDSIVDAYFPIMDDLEERIEDIEEGVIEGAEAKELAAIQGFKHIVSQVRKTIFPMREAMVGLEKGEHPNIREETCIYLRDVADHTTRLGERLEHVKEVAVLAQETYNATLANQTNVTVKRLTAVTIVFMFTGLLASLGGMTEFAGLPKDWNFFAVSLIILAITAGALIWAMWAARR
ncbi:MAG: CorA family divalent cation transporter [Candidatus Thermoplasmatota archaeon]